MWWYWRPEVPGRDAEALEDPNDRAAIEADLRELLASGSRAIYRHSPLPNSALRAQVAFLKGLSPEQVHPELPPGKLLAKKLWFVTKVIGIIVGACVFASSAVKLFTR